MKSAISRNITIKIFIIFIMSFVHIGWLDPLKDEVSSGNSKFHEKKYSEAKSHYDKAEKYIPGNSKGIVNKLLKQRAMDSKRKLSFNKGDSDYMMQNYDKAAAEFQKATQSEDKEVQKKAFFNMGNVYMKQENYKEAVKSFINALKIDPNYEKAKKNIEYILKNQQNKNNDKNNKDDKNQNEKNQSAKNNDGKNKSNDKQNKNSSKNMSKEQVKNILNSMKNNPVKRKKGKGDDRRYLEKNW